MVRPKAQEPKKQFTIMLKPTTVQEIDRLAKKVDLSRSQFMANLIEIGLDDAKLFDRSGFLYLVKMGKRAMELFKLQGKGKEKGEPMKG